MVNREYNRAGVPFAAAAVLYLDGKLTATKHNYKPVLINNVVVGGD